MKYSKNVLKNGLRVITIPIKESQTAIAMVLVETGSEYESKDINGLSHFLEHMCFKGTINRTAKQIAEELDELGAENNAFTGNIYTGYYAKARYKDLNKIMDIISDVYLNPTFPEKDIDIERGVILEELNMYKDLPIRTVAEVYSELLFGNQPAGRKIVGTKENIKNFKRDEFVKYHQTHYIPQKTTVVVAGNIDQREVVKKIQDKFGNLKKGKIVKKDPVKINQKSPKIKIEYKETDQTHMVLGVRSIKAGDKRTHALDVASALMAGTMSSRLFVKMRDELGICYYVRCDNDNSIDYGDFNISIGTGNKRAVEAIEVLIKELKRLRDEEVSPEELKRIQNSTLGRLAIRMESTSFLANIYGTQELMHLDIETPAEYIKKIKAVTASDIQKVMKQIIKNDGLNLAIVGPHRDTKKFQKALKV